MKYANTIPLQHYQSPLFGIHKPSGKAEDVHLPESQALCLPVSIEELLLANELGAVSQHAVIAVNKYSACFCAKKYAVLVYH